MNQQSFQAITAMLNAFPQSTADKRALLLTFDRALSDVSDQAISEAVDRFICGDVKDQSRTFAPSIAEFVQETRRIDELIPYRGRARLAPPPRERHREPSPLDRIRMGFKMSVLSAGIGMGKVDAVAEANARGLEDLMALAQTWGVPVPEELFAYRAA